VIAIDGPSGAGKSTVAKALANKLGFEYLDTGALYRSIALALVRAGIKPDDTDEKIKEFLVKGVKLDFIKGSIFLNGEDMSVAIRTKEMGHYSSVFSARKPVREFLLPLQRKMGEEKNLVAEGRDMTTVVFPDAWKKFYLDASEEERARRRYEQLKDSPHPITMEGAFEDVRERDRRDSSRALAPLSKSEDAVHIDSTRASSEEVLQKILDIIKKDD
jgi:cytidylate kinase